MLTQHLAHIGGPGGNRTHYPRFRKPLLYPNELQALLGGNRHSPANGANYTLSPAPASSRRNHLLLTESAPFITVWTFSGICSIFPHGAKSHTPHRADITHSPISDVETAATPGSAMSGVRTFDARTSPTALSTAAASSSIPKE